MKRAFFYSLFIFVVCHDLSLDASMPFSDAKDFPNGVPNRSARFNSDSRSFDFFANLLVWTAREVGADCWAEVITTDGSVSANILAPVNFGWDLGFKVGLGYGMEYDQWDTQAYFTWFCTQGNDRISSRPGAVHSTFMANFYVSNPTGSGISGPSYQHSGIDWIIKFNLFDWELGRNFWVSKALSLRPFLAAKGGWIHQSIHTTWKNPNFGNLPSPVPFNTGTENIRNHFWGTGPAAGLNMKWNLFAMPCQSVHLFGDFSGALMWGHWSFNDSFHNDIQQQVIVNVQDVNSGAAMVRSFMGFGWNANFNQNRCRFSAKLGYETQVWLNQLQFYSFIGGTLDTALTLQGGTFEVSFEF